jgi:hypothetical protein
MIPIAVLGKLGKGTHDMRLAMCRAAEDSQEAAQGLYARYIQNRLDQATVPTCLCKCLYAL